LELVRVTPYLSFENVNFFILSATKAQLAPKG
jgi:hypothetical protein